ncbi:MAG TPA: GNAT family N-acetyltransferase [Alphaproteobacteria bacterium]|nr:GNAT family N-acetyltransferase [Alphaproteobacteria bacterium]
MAPENSPDITVAVGQMPRADALEAKWRALEIAAEPSFFQTWNWIGPWLDSARFPVPPRLIEATREGVCVGLGILSSRRMVRRYAVVSHGLFLNETGDPEHDSIAIEHNGFLVDRVNAGDIQAACLRWLIEHDRSWNEIHLGGVPSYYADLGYRLGLRAWIKKATSSMVVDLQGCSSFDDFVARLDASTRRRYRQSLRYYRESGEIRLDAAEDISQAREYFAELKRLHILRWQALGQPHAFRGPFFERFHLALIERGLPEGRIELLRLSVGGRPIAYLYNFLLGSQVYNYQSGFEYTSASRARPGLVSHIAAIGRAIEQGARGYDLLAGATRFKSSLANREVPLVWLTLQRPQVILRAEGAARAFKNWLTSRS